MNFLLEHKEIGFIVLGAIVGSLLPKAKVHFLGKKVGEKLPTKTALMIADLIDEFEQGLRNKEFNGNKDIISNEQLTEETKIKNKYGFGKINLRVEGIEIDINPLKHKKKLIEIRAYRKAHSIRDLFKFW